MAQFNMNLFWSDQLAHLPIYAKEQWRHLKFEIQKYLSRDFCLCYDRLEKLALWQSLHKQHEMLICHLDSRYNPISRVASVLLAEEVFQTLVLLETILMD